MKNLRRVARCILLLALAAATGVSAPLGAQTYAFTDLGTAGTVGSSANGINNLGQIVGSAFSPGSVKPMLWSGGIATPLATLGGSSSNAYGINDAGVAVGFSWLPSNSTIPSHATLWSGTTATDLGTLGGNFSSARAINSTGQVAGCSHLAGDGGCRTTIWNGNSPTDLGTLGGTSSTAFGINAAGQVVGRSTAIDGSGRAALWSNTSITDLGAGHARAINSAGQIVGSTAFSPEFFGASVHAMLWSNGSAVDLGAGRQAIAINDAGQIVGVGYVGISGSGSIVTHALLWNGTTATDLNTFLDASSARAGWVLASANGINNNGWIVGSAHNQITGVDSAFVFAPVPEPETWAMMLAGFIAVGSAVRGRMRRRLASITA